MWKKKKGEEEEERDEWLLYSILCDHKRERERERERERVVAEFCSFGSIQL